MHHAIFKSLDCLIYKDFHTSKVLTFMKKTVSTLLFFHIICQQSVSFVNLNKAKEPIRSCKVVFKNPPKSFLTWKGEREREKNKHKISVNNIR